MGIHCGASPAAEMIFAASSRPGSVVHIDGGKGIICASGSSAIRSRRRSAAADQRSTGARQPRTAYQTSTPAAAHSTINRVSGKRKLPPPSSKARPSSIAPTTALLRLKSWSFKSRTCSRTPAMSLQQLRRSDKLQRPFCRLARSDWLG
jgi:hypothetical protein